MTQATRSAYDREFGEIRTDLVKMSQMVDWSIERAMAALKDKDLAVAQEVIENDDRINSLRFKLEEACFALIATQQPTAGDLRAVIAAMHIVVELERMGDHATGIAKTVIRMSEVPLEKTYKKIIRMGELSRKMLGDAIQAYLNRDVQWAKEIAAQDTEMDALYQEVFDKVVALMAKKPGFSTGATYLLWTAHNFERIADRVTNIAERTIFIATGDFQELNVGKQKVGG
jgi:phosphate transport system protein